MNPLTWVLVSIPVYLMVKGKVPFYVKLAGKQ